MLIEFNVKNYRSIRDKVTLSLRASSITEFKEDNTFVKGDQTYLRSAAIYGPNASGKSNLIKAMGFVRDFVINSARSMQAADDIPVRPFKLDLETAKAPSYFEILFLLQETRYRYGFEVDQKKVKAEWLFALTSSRESVLFVRNEKGIEVRNSFKEGRNLEAKTRDNALFLSVVAQFNGEISNRILKWFKSFNVLSGIEDARYEGITLQAFEKSKHREKIIEMLRLADFGIDDLSVKEYDLTEDRLPKDMPPDIKKEVLSKFKDAKTYEVVTSHKMLPGRNRDETTIQFDFETEESEGTKKFFHFAGPILVTLANGSVLVIDELDTKLHPNLTRAIVLLFNSKKTNPRNAQLVFATHNTMLLSTDILRRDQIWFVEKNKSNVSDLYSLVEYKLPDTDSKVRKDASFEKEYIHGRYGAVPILGNLSKLFEEK
jgi:hypothetical protein